MDSQLRQNRQTLALIVAGALGVAAFLTASTWPVAITLLLLALVFGVLALFGDRVQELSGGGLKMKLVAERVAEATKRAVTHEGKLTFDAEIAARKIEGSGNVVASPPTIDARGEALPPSVVVTPDPARLKLTTYPPSVIIDAHDAIKEARTPEELAEKVVEFVRLVDRTDRQAVVDHLADLTPEQRAVLLDEAASEQTE